MSETRYLSHMDEISIFCDLNRKRADVLEEVSRRFSILDAEADGIFEELDEDTFANLQMFNEDETDKSVIQRIEKQIEAQRPPAADRDKEVEERHERRENEIQKLERPEVRDLVSKWIICLRLYSKCLRNLEDINGATKSAHGAIIMKGWGRLLKSAIGILGEIYEQGSFEVGSFKFSIDPAEKTVPFGASDDEVVRKRRKLVRWLYVVGPLMIMDYLKSDLGSEKLSLILSDDTHSIPLSGEFLRSTLYANLMLKEYPARIDKLRKFTGGSTFLSRVLIFAMNKLYLTAPLEGMEEKAFREMLGRILHDLQGGSENSVARNINNVKRHKLVQKLQYRGERE